MSIVARVQAWCGRGGRVVPPSSLSSHISLLALVLLVRQIVDLVGCSQRRRSECVCVCVCVYLFIRSSISIAFFGLPYSPKPMRWSSSSTAILSSLCFAAIKTDQLERFC